MTEGESRERRETVLLSSTSRLPQTAQQAQYRRPPHLTLYPPRRPRFPPSPLPSPPRVSKPAPPPALYSRDRDSAHEHRWMPQIRASCLCSVLSTVLRCFPGSAPPPPAVPPTLSLADFLRQFSITKSPFEDHPPGISTSSSTASSLSARQTAPTLEPTQIFYEPTLAQELEDGFLALLELHHSEVPSFQAALAMPLSLLAAFSLYGQDLISEARNVSHFQGTIGTSVRQMVGLYDQCIRPTKPRELHFLQETDNSGGRTLGTMLVRTDVCLREREGGKDKVLALIEFKRA